MALKLFKKRKSLGRTYYAPQQKKTLTSTIHYGAVCRRRRRSKSGWWADGWGRPHRSSMLMSSATAGAFLCRLVSSAEEGLELCR